MSHTHSQLLHCTVRPKLRVQGDFSQSINKLQYDWTLVVCLGIEDIILSDSCWTCLDRGLWLACTRLSLGSLSQSDSPNSTYTGKAEPVAPAKPNKRGESRNEPQDPTALDNDTVWTGHVWMWVCWKRKRQQSRGPVGMSPQCNAHLDPPSSPSVQMCNIIKACCFLYFTMHLITFSRILFANRAIVPKLSCGLSPSLRVDMWAYLAPLQCFQPGLMPLTASCSLNGVKQETHSCHQNTLYWPEVLVIKNWV